MAVNFGQAQFFNNNYEIGGAQDFFSTSLYNDSAIYVDGHCKISSTIGGNLIAKINLNGDTIFVKKYLRDSTMFFGGNGTTLVKLKNNLYSIGVYTKLSPLINIAYIQKFNLDGDSLGYYEQTAPFGVVYNGISITRDNKLIVTGYVRPTSSNLDVLLEKFDTLLNPLWSQNFGGPLEDTGWNVDTTSDGGFVIGGLTQSIGAGLRDAYLIKTDSLGNFQWQKTYGGSDHDVGRALSINGNEILFYGGFDLGTAMNDRNLFLRKYDYSGNLILNTPIVCTEKLLNTITCIKDGNFLYFNTYCKIDTFSTSIPVADIIKTDLTGNIIWNNYYLLSQNANYTTGMIQLPDKSLVTSGYLFSDGITVMTEDAWLFRVDSMGCFIPGCSVGVAEINVQDLRLNVFPNPSSGVFNLTFDDFIANGLINVTNSLGQNVFSINNFSGHEVQINLDNEPKGIYFIGIRNKENNFTTKILVE
jgi:hypothetical protein